MERDTVHYIVFEPDQIKSALGNSTFKKSSRRFTESFGLLREHNKK